MYKTAFLCYNNINIRKVACNKHFNGIAFGSVNFE